ncbi:hypothetical protein [Pyruvatibacter mobilis]|uniref:hypothetical protein n=1 Tax=Pyruvatibacter mobilis TaxID=1712261 RepID=UPI003BB0A0EB
MTDLKIEEGKCYRTRDGRKVHILAKRTDTDSKAGRYMPFIGHVERGPSGAWGLDGSSSSFQPNADLVSEWKEPRKGEVWVNVYAEQDQVSFVFTTRKAADEAAEFGVRLACIRVPWTEGQGLGEGSE